MAKKKVKDAARDLLGDFLGEHSLELFNIEFVKEGRDRYLRVYIDKPEESGEYVSIDECELVTCPTGTVWTRSAPSGRSI